MTVIDLDQYVRYTCPHCDSQHKLTDLDRHLRYECPVLESKRRHPSQRQTPDGAA
jgi:hypothetical protein